MLGFVVGILSPFPQEFLHLVDMGFGGRRTALSRRRDMTFVLESGRKQKRRVCKCLRPDAGQLEGSRILHPLNTPRPRQRAGPI